MSQGVQPGDLLEIRQVSGKPKRVIVTRVLPHESGIGQRVEFVEDPENEED